MVEDLHLCPSNVSVCAVGIKETLIIQSCWEGHVEVLMARLAHCRALDILFDE